MHRYVLSSPSRLKWVKKPMDSCLFCGIAEGDPDIPKKVLYKSKDILVIMNLFPYNTGHLQVAPVKHVVGLDELSEGEVSDLFGMVRKCVKLLKKVLDPKGFNIGVNIGGGIAGASVEHLHVHVVPRFERDFGFMEIIGETKVLPEPVDKTFEKLKREKSILE